MGGDGKSDLEAISEDALGFNLRSLRTLRDLVIRPAAVMHAYAAGDRETYTPALRIWLGLLGLQFFFAVFSGGYGGLMTREIEQEPEQAMAGLLAEVGVDAAAFADRMGEIMSFLQAPVVGLFTALTIFLLGVWNRELTRTARFNIAFAILSGGSVVGLFLAPVAVLNPGAAAFALPLIGLAYFITFYRGGQGLLASTRTGAAVRGLVHSSVTLALVLLAGAVVGMVSVTIAIFTLADVTV
ncbi:DUF3667 domain-containing protein [Maricaulis sp. CAU 1757]